MRSVIEESAWSDSRIIQLSIHLKMPVWAAVGAMAAIWRHCQNNKTDLINDVLIKHLIGKKNFGPLAVDSGLLECLGENEYRVRGMEDRLKELEKFFEKRSSAGKLGNEVRWAKHRERVANGIANGSQCDSDAIANGSQGNRKLSRLGLGLGLGKENTNDLANAKSTAEQVRGDSQPDQIELFEAEVVDDRKLKLEKTAQRRVRNKTLNKPSEKDFELADRWLAHARKVSPGINASLESFAEALAEVRRKYAPEVSPDKQDELLEAVFNFIANDSFWSTNAVSPGGLLKKSEKNGLRKIDNIVSRMNEPRFKQKVAEEKADELDLSWIKKSREACL